MVTEEFLVLGIKIRRRTTKGRWGQSPVSHISMPFIPSCSAEDTGLPALSVKDFSLAASVRLEQGLTQPVGSDLLP